MNGLWSVLRHQVLIPLALPAGLVLLALLLRSFRALWFRLRQGGFPPIVIHSADNIKSRVFAARLTENLAQEAPGPTVIIPPGSGAPPQPVPVEQLSGRGGWVATLMRIVLSREPAFDVYVECPQHALTRTDLPGYLVIIRITRIPGNRVLAADRLHGEVEAHLIDTAGCLVIHSIRQQPGALRHTPRWERWSPDIQGYASYRRALQYERQGELDSALVGYDQALRHEPGSFLISIRKAAVLEGMGKFRAASEVYRTCNELWPEHIQTAYRLSASYANDKDFNTSESVLKGIQQRLHRSVLWEEQGKTWWPTRWNIGERDYWKSWSRLHPRIFGSSDRHHLLMAVQVAEQVRSMGRILSRDLSHEVTIDDLITRMAVLTMRRNPASPYIHLFHPELLVNKKPAAGKGAAEPTQRHCSSWHNENDDKDQVIYPLTLYRLPRSLRPRKQIGWLAHYNAACFYSLAMGLDEKSLPSGYTIEQWCADCARAAIRELGYVRRDPLGKIEPHWYKRDPELQPLRDHVGDSRWAKFVGL